MHNPRHGTSLRPIYIFTFFYLLMLALACLVSLQPSSAQVKADWKQRWESVLNEAKREGRVVLFGPPGPLIRQSITDGFRRAFPGIDMEYTGARGDELATKLRAERQAGLFSTDAVVSGTTTAALYLKPLRALDPIGPTLILPEVTEGKYWRENRLEFADLEGRYNLVFSDQVLPPLVYHPDQVKIEEIDQLHKLLDPKWKGKIVINDPLPSGPGNVTFRWIWHVLGPDKAKDYYRKIRAQAAAVDRDQRRQIEWIAQGKYPLLLGPSSTVGQQLLQSGLKFAISAEFKDAGGFISATFGSVMLLNKAPHPSAATLFINWLLTKDGQMAWSKSTNAPSRRLDVPTDHLPPYVLFKPGVKYWISHLEKDVRRSPDQEKILKELFGG